MSSATEEFDVIALLLGPPPRPPRRFLRARLPIAGIRQAEKEEKNDRWYCYERSYGSFTRSCTLPDDAEVDKLRAAMERGVLTVRVPKKPEVAVR